MKTIRFAQHASGLLLVALVGVLYALVAQPSPVAFYERNYSADRVEPGMTLTVRGEALRTDACSRKTTRTWIDQEGNTLGAPLVEYEPRIPAGRREFNVRVTVPEKLPAGIIRYRVRSVYYCNFLQRVLGIGSDLVLPDVIFNTQNRP